MSKSDKEPWWQKIKILYLILEDLKEGWSWRKKIFFAVVGIVLLAAVLKMIIK